jgi:hypothetical protein
VRLNEHLVPRKTHATHQKQTQKAEIRATKRLTFGDGMGNHTVKQPWMGWNATSNLPFCVVERGSLTFALALETTPAGPYGFALDCNATNMKLIRSPMPAVAWDWPLAAPMAISVKAAPFDWQAPTSVFVVFVYFVHFSGRVVETSCLLGVSIVTGALALGAHPTCVDEKLSQANMGLQQD